ncbi:hypothetical protein KZZ52_21545 [Dactylosporangium sp. AC04546]|uniref:hypothetical protein n=1 Tax=Dactylosporangium sp. AC04546 TaxID=2862460 RepID=UPI001EE04BF7|nr:hypothetical protein [Dactylosporangium sp. AC04546]WVK87866.1 hypothetical protein KZZ52_21545 [Dactylosporangium sp. AC04546]
MTLKKTLTFAAWAFVIYFVAFRPDAAANVVRGIGGLIATLGRGFGDFFSRLVT